MNYVFDLFILELSFEWNNQKMDLCVLVQGLPSHAPQIQCPPTNGPYQKPALLGLATLVFGALTLNLSIVWLLESITVMPIFCFGLLVLFLALARRRE